jgi:hypothetical protein
MLKIGLFLIFTVARIRSYEITGGSADTLIVAGERLELSCEIDGEYDFCSWSYSDDTWACLTNVNADGEELPCEDQERATITGTEGSCTVGS